MQAIAWNRSDRELLGKNYDLKAIRALIGKIALVGSSNAMTPSHIDKWIDSEQIKTLMSPSSEED